MDGDPPVTFGGLLRRLRGEAGLTQEELAEAASLSPRSVSDLERGVNLTARRETAQLLAGALRLEGPARAAFEAAARGRAPAGTLAAEGVAAGGMAAATRTLPRDIASFTGRDGELREIVTAAADPGGMAGIHVIGGMAGIGKTTFALHAAHRLAPRFPDGQIFLSLHGHTPGQQPVDPADALASLLLTAGVAAQQIPAGLEARMALWRDRLAGKQLLLLLDDAVGTDQIRPLLPGAPGSMVLVTSRRHLTALDDARAVSLDTLPPDDAAALLARLAGRPGIDPADPDVREITRLCGYLPLAVGLLARQLHHHPAWTAADLAGDLAAARDRLELMAAENLSVAAAFDLSYADLTDGQRRLFRRLGLHPGLDVDTYAAAALGDVGLADARRDLEAMYGLHLIAEPSRGRYRFHDLIREHARTLASADDPAERGAAFGRLSDYFQHTVTAADGLIPRRIPAVAPLSAPDARARPACAPEFAAMSDAAAWLTAERLNLHAIASYAGSHGLAGHTVAIAAAMHSFLRAGGHWDQALALHRSARDAARQAGDRLGEAIALVGLGDIQNLTGDYPAAAADLANARVLFHELGNALGEAGALTRLGFTESLAGDYPAARGSQEQALGLFRGMGDRLGEANALKDLGVLLTVTGDYPAAMDSQERALELYRGIGNRLGEANSLNCLGSAQTLADDYPAAYTSLGRALDLFRELGNRNGEAFVLTALGVVDHLAGDYQAAAGRLTASAGLFRGLGNRLGEANTVKDLGAVQAATGDLRAAAASQHQALRLFDQIGNRPGKAGALHYLGAVQCATGDHRAAADSLAQALEIFHGLGDRHGEAEVSNAIGELELAAGRVGEAMARHEQALEIASDISSLREQARAMEGMGACHIRDGNDDQAAAVLRQALAIYQRIRSPRAELVLATLGDQPAGERRLTRRGACPGAATAGSSGS